MRILLLCFSLLILSACATQSDTVEDRRRGQSLVCHKQKHTEAVSTPNYLRHLEHGDSAGPCPNEE